jgi:phage recombination protein Bet
MTNALARISQVTGYERDQIQLVKDTIARGASDDELILFLHLARRSGLDPFARQIYLIERRAHVNGAWVTTRQPQTAIDGLRLIADRTERYAPGHEPTFEYDADGRLLKATAYIKKFVRGEWHEVAASAHYDEYVGRTSKGEVTRMWAEKPHIMLAKCAEALALRRAFPAEMSGLYTGDEMGEATAPTVVDVRTGEIVDEPRKALPEASYEPPPEPAPTANGKKPPTREGMIKRILDLTAQAEDLDLEIVLAKPIKDMTEAELVQHGRNLNAAIAEAEARDIQPVAA